MRSRCQSCNKFCSTEVGDSTVNEIVVDIDHEAMKTWKPGESSFLKLQVDAGAERLSTCCGDTVAEARIDPDYDHVVEDEDVLSALKHHYDTEVGDDEHETEADEEEVNYVEEGLGKRDSPYIERLDVQWAIKCCGQRLGEGTVSCIIEEWEECS